jgi:hypothetical protein
VRFDRSNNFGLPDGRDLTLGDLGLALPANGIDIGLTQL